MAEPSIKQTLRMSGDDLESLLVEMNKQHCVGDSVQRVTKRWQMQSQKVVMTIVGDHGERTHYATIPRNLSTGGISVLHGGYLHIGQTCHISLRGVTGQGDSMSGEIVRCRHVRGAVHEIGIRFHSSINPRDFFVLTHDDYLFDAEHVVPSELSGRILVVCENRADQKLIQHLFHEADVLFTFAEDGESGLEQLAAEPDLAFVDELLPGMNGIDVVSEARRRAMTTPIVLLSQSDDEEHRFAAIGAGAKEVVRRPIEPRVIYRAAAEFLLLSPMLGSNENGTSLAANAGDDSKVLFCSELKVLAEQITSAIENEDLLALSTHLGRIGAAAGVYGFPDLDKRAKSTLDKLRSGASFEMVRSESERLSELCNARSVESPQSEAGGQGGDQLKQSA